MQYYIEAIDTENHAHKLGAGRYWFAAVRHFNALPKHELKQAKLIMLTETGHRLNTVIRYPSLETRKAMA